MPVTDGDLRSRDVAPDSIRDLCQVNIPVFFSRVICALRLLSPPLLDFTRISQIENSKTCRVMLPCAPPPYGHSSFLPLPPWSSPLSCCRLASSAPACPSRLTSLFRQRRMRGRPMTFTFQHAADRPRTFGGGFLLRRRLAFLHVALCLFSRRLRGCAFFRRRQVHSSPPRLRQADGNRLFGRGRTVLAFADVVHLLFHEFAGLSARAIFLRVHPPAPALMFLFLASIFSSCL